MTPYSVVEPSPAAGLKALAHKAQVFRPEFLARLLIGGRKARERGLAGAKGPHAARAIAAPWNDSDVRSRTFSPQGDSVANPGLKPWALCGRAFSPEREGTFWDFRATFWDFPGPFRGLPAAFWIFPAAIKVFGNKACGPVVSSGKMSGIPESNLAS